MPSESLIQRAVRRHGAEAVWDALTAEQKNALRYEWRAFARPEQLAPESDWDVWLYLAGRGAGKTRTAAEWVRSLAESDGSHRIALVSSTAADVRDVLIEGESGIMAVSPPWFRPLYEPSKRRLMWRNGAMATTYSAEEPDRLRGPQHSAAVCDELAAWYKPEDTWNMLQFGLRLGARPRVMIATTPRPIELLRRLIKSPKTVLVSGSTFDNVANLAPAFIASVRDRYEGTRLARQELYAEILEDVEGALWRRDSIDGCRVREVPELRRIVVAVDPSGGHDAENDEQGIVVAGVDARGHGYVLEDASCKLPPAGWGRAVVNAFVKHKADRICYERNFGGEMVEHVIKTAAKELRVNVALKEVHASRGKVVRAEPIAALYEQGKVHHLGILSALEDQLCLFTPGGEFQKSPDRADSLVWALTELMLHDEVAYERSSVISRRRI